MEGGKISIQNGKLVVPDQPIIPFIEGDGTGPDIWAASVRVMDAAVEKAYGGKKKIVWKEVLAGEKAFNQTGSWLPDETLDAFKEYLVGIKGPLTTPVGGGIRSLNVALRQILDLYVCLRPVRWFEGTPSPVKNPGAVDMTIFRENTEDIYAGIEFAAGTPENAKVMEFIAKEFPKEFNKIRFGTTEKAEAYLKTAGADTSAESVAVNVGIGIKAVSKVGTERLVAAAIEFAILHGRKWEQTKKEKGEAAANDEQKAALASGKILVKDAIADIALQQVLTRPEDFDVIATLNLNGDYLSDALAAQVGGIGIAPGANINYVTGHAIFEATHGTAPKYANQDKVNPGSVILSGAMMMEHLGWHEAAQLMYSGIEKSIAAKRVTYDFHRLMEGATMLKCSEFGDEIIKNM